MAIYAAMASLDPLLDLRSGYFFFIQNTLPENIQSLSLVIDLSNFNEFLHKVMGQF
jgi:hypothetical protein